MLCAVHTDREINAPEEVVKYRFIPSGIDMMILFDFVEAFATVMSAERNKHIKKNRCHYAWYTLVCKTQPNKKLKERNEEKKNYVIQRAHSHSSIKLNRV